MFNKIKFKQLNLLNFITCLWINLDRNPIGNLPTKEEK